MKASRKLTTIRNNEGRNGPQNLSRNLITAQCSQSVSLNFRFLHGMNVLYYLEQRLMIHFMF